MTPSEFITRWSASSGAERANKDSFLIELCDVLGVARPAPTTGNPKQDVYVLEADAITTHSGGKTTIGKMDLYKQGSFILEAKQGSGAGALKLGTAKRGTGAWAIEMEKAYGQALNYSYTLETPPPFLIVCDIGHCFDIYASFDGGPYHPYPHPRARRIFLADLNEHIGLLRSIWEDPFSLDPSLKKAQVTRDIAGHLAELAMSLEKRGHDAQLVAKFLMRSLFTMFAEDAGLLPQDVFKDALEKHWRTYPERFAPEIEALWQHMDKGGYHFGLGKILRFNGALFADAHAIPLERLELDLLYQAACCDWRDVEPAIFGTLLERALNPKERHQLGAHYTPRPYVERLVRPTVEEPLRQEWEAIRAAAVAFMGAGKEAQARNVVGDFHVRLCGLRVLDPACGTGNFLYVAMDLMKRLEGEVLTLLQDLGDNQGIFGQRVNPRQFLGIEKKPWAREIADLVLWVGYLSAQLRNLGKGRQMAEPVLEKLDNIQCRDAVLTWEREEAVMVDGQALTRWDGVTTKKHPVTGEEVPDETVRVSIKRYIGARPAEWPEADFIVGNPPFLGKGEPMRSSLGESYLDALRKVYPEVPDSADYVLYWWNNAAKLLQQGQVRRFGFITTNSIHQVFNRRILQQYMDGSPPISIVYAIPDHPWSDSASAAAVRIAMTVAVNGLANGVLNQVISEISIEEREEPIVTFQSSYGFIHANLRIGANIASVTPLLANSKISSNGMMLAGAGFQVIETEIEHLDPSGKAIQEGRLRRYRNGRDLAATPRNMWLIDLFGLSAQEVLTTYPALYQRVVERVKPERDNNNRPALKRNWWLFAEPRKLLRAAMVGLPRYITTVETTKHRVFQFLSSEITPDHMLIAIASTDAFHLGVLSSHIHVVWALAAGARLGVGNDPRYTKSRCFEPFPFPEPPLKTRQTIASLAESIDAHRKRQQAQHPDLTLTNMYNVLQTLREGRTLNEKEKVIHQQALTSILKDLHDALNQAVADAYGWPVDLDDEGILERLVALNTERAAEEASGKIRWLRPDFQNPSGAGSQQQDMGLEAEEALPPPQPTEKIAWPGSLPDQVAAVRTQLGSLGEASTDTIAASFSKAPKKDLIGILELLGSLGFIVALPGKRWKVGR